MKKLLLASTVMLAAIGGLIAADNHHNSHKCQSNTQPKVVAHRGYWTAPGSAQNSIRSLVKADSIGAYASEFDVWMTTDSVLVLNHDSSINDVVIQHSPSELVLQQRLPNGEFVPTLEQFLDTAATLNIRLVLELKEHEIPSTRIAAARKCVDIIRQKGLTDRTTYITFSPMAFEEFIKYAPENESYFLYELLGPDQIKEMGGTGIDYNIGHFWNDNLLTQKCHDMGLKVNIWTVDSDEDINFSINQGVDYITTNQPERCAELIKAACAKHCGHRHHP